MAGSCSIQSCRDLYSVYRDFVPVWQCSASVPDPRRLMPRQVTPPQPSALPPPEVCETQQREGGEACHPRGRRGRRECSQPARCWKQHTPHMRVWSCKRELSEFYTSKPVYASLELLLCGKRRRKSCGSKGMCAKSAKHPQVMWLKSADIECEELLEKCFYEVYLRSSLLRPEAQSYINHNKCDTSKPGIVGTVTASIW